MDTEEQDYSDFCFHELRADNAALQTKVNELTRELADMTHSRYLALRGMADALDDEVQARKLAEPFYPHEWIYAPENSASSDAPIMDIVERMAQDLAVYKRALEVMLEWYGPDGGCVLGYWKLKLCMEKDCADCDNGDQKVMDAALSEAAAQLTREALDAQCADTGHTEAEIQAMKEAGHD